MRSSRTSRWLACAVLAMSMAPSRAFADGTQDASSHFTRGVELYKEGDFRAALIEFQRAYDAAPNYKVLYNLGQTSLELQDYAGALKAFRGYLDGGGRDVPPARRTQVEGDLKRLDSRVARVDVAVNVDGADITIDDVSVGRSPLREPVLVGAGRRKIAATKTGFSSASRVIDVAGGDKPRISLDLVEPQQATQIVTVQSPNANDTDAHRGQSPIVVVRTATGPSTAFWIGVGITGAGAIATGVLGGLALSSKSTFDSRVSQPGVQTSAVDGARQQTRDFALATDIAGIATIAAAVTTVILAFTTNSKHEVREAAHARIVVGPGTLGIAGEM